MKAIVLKEFGSVDNLLLTDIPAPEIADQEVLIRVKAISINPVDAKTRAGKGIAARLKDFHPVLLGWDVSGVVVRSKSPVFMTGDHVFGMVNFPGHGKAYAEWVAAPAGHLARKPDNITHEEAAAATLAALTAWQALIHYADVQAGQRVLILAAAGGVGHYAVQLAKHLGAYTIGVSSGVNKDFVVSLGADEHIDYTTQRFEETVSQVDLVLDNLGGDSVDRSLKITKKGGTIISIPSALSMEVADKAKAQGINGYSILVQSNADDMGGVAHLLTKGIIKSFVSHVFPFEEMRKAHLQIETGKTKGKVIVTF